MELTSCIIVGFDFLKLEVWSKLQIGISVSYCVFIVCSVVLLVLCLKCIRLRGSRVLTGTVALYCVAVRK